MKHLKSWVLDDANAWQGTAASFGPDRVQNVHCAVFIPAQHAGRALGDSCIVTGFPDGALGMWIPPFPTKAGSRYSLQKVYRGHDPGPLITMVDGSQQYGGVRCLTVCKKAEDGPGGTSRAMNPGMHGQARQQMLLSGGADGAVRRWALHPPGTITKAGLPSRGAVLVCAACDNTGGCSCHGEVIVHIREPSLPDQGEVNPMIKGLDWHHSQV